MICNFCEQIYEYKDEREHYNGNCKKKEVRTFGKVRSTKLPRLELIPKSALEALANRFELGVERKGDGAWNALTLDKNETLINKDFVLDRLSHTIHHCYDAIRKIIKGVELEGEEDAGAILFGGSVLAEYKRLVLKNTIARDNESTTRTE